MRKWRNANEQVALWRFRPINLGHVSEVAVRPLREQHLMRPDCMLVNLRPRHQLIIEIGEVLVQPLQCEALAIVPTTKGNHPQRIVFVVLHRIHNLFDLR